jgi:hypothetical protein
MRTTQIVSMLAVLWGGFVLGKAAANGFEFETGSYGNGSEAAIVLAVIVILVAGAPAHQTPPPRQAVGDFRPR